MKFFVIAAGVALQATLLVLAAPYLKFQVGVVDFNLNSWVWVCFQSWAVYFLAGCTLQGGIKGFLGYLCGIIMTVLIIAIAGPIGGTMGFPVGVFVMVVVAILCEKVSLLSLIPAWFVASGAFFSQWKGIPAGSSLITECMKIGVPEFIAGTVGLAFGWITVFWRGAYERKFMKPAPAPAPARLETASR
jgi:hypothetical protein